MNGGTCSPGQRNRMRWTRSGVKPSSVGGTSFTDTTSIVVPFSLKNPITRLGSFNGSASWLMKRPLMMRVLSRCCSRDADDFANSVEEGSATTAWRNGRCRLEEAYLGIPHRDCPDPADDPF